MEESPRPRDPYYRDDLALVHHLGFGFHADDCAPSLLRILEPIRRRDGVVVELGCGSGLLTAHLTGAGHRVLATDASEAMLRLARRHAPSTSEIRCLVLPHDPIPSADAIVGVGHVLNYLDDEVQVKEALVAIATSLRPGGIMALDLCDLEWGRHRTNQAPLVLRTAEWVLVTEFSVPQPDRFVRTMTTFIHQKDGSWRRDDECHHNVLIDTSRLPELLAHHGVEATVSNSFGGAELPSGLVAVVGRKIIEPLGGRR